MDYNQYTAVDFLADESFQCYCAGNIQEHVSFWREYILNHPEKQEEITVAIEMYGQLSGHKRPVSVELEHFKQQMRSRTAVPYPEAAPELSETYVTEKGKIRIYKYALLCLAVLVSGFFIWKKKDTSGVVLPEGSVLLSKNVYHTEKTQRKKITFEDGTIVLLNAETKISLRRGYNKETREVDLIGEAFFEVEHNAAVPFIVHTSKMDIKVLGTKFNVSAYPDERKTQASLIIGSIQASLNDNSHRHFVLKPREKITIEEPQAAAKNEGIQKNMSLVSMSNIRLSDKNVVVETAWINNGLEITDETFAELQQKLEREYGVTFIFKNEEVKQYRFTATLKNEPINEVLKAMQTVNHFNYKIKGNTVQLSK